MNRVAASMALAAVAFGLLIVTSSCLGEALPPAATHASTVAMAASVSRR